MYLSDTQQVIDFLDKYASGSLISGCFRSRGGTLIKLYGSKQISGFFFHLKEKVIIPVTNISLFPKEPMTRLEEGLRSNFYGKTISFSVMPEFGKTVKIGCEKHSLVIPLFGGKSVRIVDSENNVLWIDRNDNGLKLLEKPMKGFPLTFEDPLFWESAFVENSNREKQLEKEQLLEKKRQKVLSLIKIVEDEIARHTEDQRVFSENAALLKANLYLFDGSEHKNSISLADLEGNRKEIKLDPAKSIVQNMERFFDGIKKAKSGIANSGSRLETLKSDLEKLNDINELSEDAAAAKTKKTARKQNVHVPYHEFHAANGRIFLVGKEEKDNDELTFKIAMPHDIWIHAKDYHGSHVIMRMKKNEEPKREDILVGCALAIIYSKAKKGRSGEVWFTARKNVMKRKGMAAGLVNFKNAKSVYMSDVVLPEGLVKIDQ